MDREAADDELDSVVFLGARAHLEVRRALQAVHHGRVRNRAECSRPGRRHSRPRDFDLGARANMRDYFGVDGQPPVYGADAFDERFRMPRVEVYGR